MRNIFVIGILMMVAVFFIGRGLSTGNDIDRLIKEQANFVTAWSSYFQEKGYHTATDSYPAIGLSLTELYEKLSEGAWSKRGGFTPDGSWKILYADDGVFFVGEGLDKAYLNLYSSRESDGSIGIEKDDGKGYRFFYYPESVTSYIKRIEDIKKKIKEELGADMFQKQEHKHRFARIDMLQGLVELYIYDKYRYPKGGYYQADSYTIDGFHKIEIGGQLHITALPECFATMNVEKVYPPKLLSNATWVLCMEERGIANLRAKGVEPKFEDFFDSEMNFTGRDESTDEVLFRVNPGKKRTDGVAMWVTMNGGLHSSSLFSKTKAVQDNYIEKLNMLKKIREEEAIKKLTPKGGTANVRDR